MANSLRWTSSDLELLPDDGKRYEIVEGELYVSKQPHWHHQVVCGRLFALLDAWSRQTRSGAPSIAPGIIFDEDEDVAPDVVWVSKERLAGGLAEDGKLHSAPDLAVEVLSPGLTNERRDRDAKLKLYARRGVLEYWIVDWRVRQIEIYRREQLTLTLIGTLRDSDTLVSPLLPGFTGALNDIFDDMTI
jgi:Uma2 family endonuclease